MHSQEVTQASRNSNDNCNTNHNGNVDVLRTWRRMTLHPFQG